MTDNFGNRKLCANSRYPADWADLMRRERAHRPETIVEQDRQEHADAARFDTTRYRRIGTGVYDATDVPDLRDLINDLINDRDDWSDQ